MTPQELHAIIEAYFLEHSEAMQGRSLILTNWYVSGVMVDPTTSESGICGIPYGEPSTVVGMLDTCHYREMLRATGLFGRDSGPYRDE